MLKTAATGFGIDLTHLLILALIGLLAILALHNLGYGGAEKGIGLAQVAIIGVLILALLGFI
jgi:hypothetical protein